jgi:hypothetical protein
MIYFAQPIDGGPVKIGYAADVPKRLKQLEAHYRAPLALLATMEGDRPAEAAIHERFSHLRFGRKEQFRPASELMEFIGKPLLVDPNPDAVEAIPSAGAPDKIIALRCTAAYRKRVEQAAKKEFRDSSGMLALALQEYFEKRGYDPLPPRLGEPE